MRRDSSILKVFQVADDCRGWGREDGSWGSQIRRYQRHAAVPRPGDQVSLFQNWARGSFEGIFDEPSTKPMKPIMNIIEKQLSAILSRNWRVLCAASSPSHSASWSGSNRGLARGAGVALRRIYPGGRHPRGLDCHYGTQGARRL